MRFLSVEYVLPSRAVTNEEVLDQILAASRRTLPGDDAVLLQRLLRSCFDACGTQVRYHRAPGEVAFDLAAEVGERALRSAGVDPAEVDLLIYTGVGRGVLEPASATAFQARLRLRNATAFDVFDACASWVRSLEVAHALITAGRHRTVMIVNAEFGARESYRYGLANLDDYLHWHPTMTLGEAATATVLAAGGGPAAFDCDFRTFGDRWDLCYVPLPAAESFFGATLPVASAEPLQFVSFGARLMEFACDRLVAQYLDQPRFAEFRPDIVFGHAASDGMSRTMLERCGIDSALFRFEHANSANTVSATVPIALARAVRQGELRPGDRVLLMVASSGVTTGLASFQYQN